MILIYTSLKLNLLSFVSLHSFLRIKIYLFLLLNFYIYGISFQIVTSDSFQSGLLISIFPLHNISCSFHPCHVFDGSFSSNFGDDNILFHTSFISRSRSYSDHGTATIGIFTTFFIYFEYISIFRKLSLSLFNWVSKNGDQICRQLLHRGPHHSYS